MHLISSSKLKVLFLLPVLLLLFSFADGIKKAPSFPLSKDFVEAKAFNSNEDFSEGIIEDENAYYFDGEYINPTKEVLCEDEDFAAIWTCSDISSNFQDFFL